MWELLTKGLTVLGGYLNTQAEVAPSAIDFSSYEEISSRKRTADYELAGKAILGIIAGGGLVYFSRKTKGMTAVIILVVVAFIIVMATGIQKRSEQLAALPYDPADYGDPATWKIEGNSYDGFRWTGPPGTEPYNPETGIYRSPRNTRQRL